MKSCDTPVPTNDDVLCESPVLEFPDWSGMLPHRTHKTFAQAVQWNEAMLALFPPGKRSAKLEAERRCHAEFVL